MITKGQILKALEDIPDDTTIEDAMERLYFLLKIEQGLADIQAGRVVTHEEAVERMSLIFSTLDPAKHVKTERPR